ncbi:MAG: OadG family transporter subunit [Bacteroidota bacterium]|nr:OadG family transporter subunit [Bacteroidota bacterium]
MHNKMPYKFILAAVLFLSLGLSSGKSYGQNAKDLRINEFLVYNDSSYIDDYGRHSAWIEIFNAAKSQSNIGGLYLTNDLQNPTKYLIPAGDQRTVVAPHGYTVFWADNKTVQGPLHLNFDLKNSKVIALFAADGKTLIDSVSIPQKQTADVSYGRQQDGSATWTSFTSATPCSNNDVTQASSKQQFGKLDAKGFGNSLIIVVLIFVALIILSIFYKKIAKALGFKVNESEDEAPETAVPAEEDEISGEVKAAITMALYLYKNQLKENEKTKLTIQHVSRTYSPWSSKIYGLRKSPR